MKCRAIRLFMIGYGPSQWTTVPCVRKGWFHFKHVDAEGIHWYGRIGN